MPCGGRLGARWPGTRFVGRLRDRDMHGRQCGSASGMRQDETLCVFHALLNDGRVGMSMHGGSPSDTGTTVAYSVLGVTRADGVVVPALCDAGRGVAYEHTSW